MSVIRSVCVFCGATVGDDPAFAEAAKELGTGIAEAGLALVFGGGSKGMMGAVASAALASGGRTVGVIPRFLSEIEIAHQESSKLHIVDDMHARKRKMFDLSDAFVALPGGLGTLDETVEMIAWGQLGRHDKPVILISTHDYWTPFLRVIDQIVSRKFAHHDIPALFRVVDTPAEALRFLGARPRSGPGRGISRPTGESPP